MNRNLLGLLAVLVAIGLSAGVFFWVNLSGSMTTTVQPANAPPASPVPPAASGSQTAAAFPQPAPPAPWEADLANGDADRGKVLFAKGLTGAIPSCQTCHGQNGLQREHANTPMPRLAGLSADYVAEQIVAYKQKRRGVGSQMEGVAATLQPNEIADAAVYVATLKLPTLDAVKVAGGPERARQLDAVGDNALALPACANCHGPQGRGQDRLLPPLAGLAPEYSAGRLGVWKRENQPGARPGVMAAFAKRLSDQDIDDLSRYYAGLY